MIWGRCTALPKTSGIESLSVQLKRIPKKFEKQADRAMFVIVDRVKADAQHSITSGSVSGRGHIASKPGEAPNADTRQLDTSIIAKRIGKLKHQTISKAPYSKALEEGTGKMEARPFMQPAVKRNLDFMRKVMRRAVGKAVKK